MSAPHGEQIVGGYLAQLELALANVSVARRREIIDGIREHIAQARDQLSDETDADVLNVVGRLGEPAEVAAAAGLEVDARASSVRGMTWTDVVAVVLTPIFWPAGVILLWMSSVFTLRDKLIGTLVPPGGFIGTYIGFMAFFVFGMVTASYSGSGASCTTTTDSQGNVSGYCGPNPPDAAQVAIYVASIVVLIAWLVLPVLTGIYLGIRLRRRTSVATPAFGAVAAMES